MERTAINGEDVKLSCLVENSDAQSSWYYRENLSMAQVSAKVAFEDTSIDTDGALCISTVIPSHEGYYHCEDNGDPILLVILGMLAI